MLSIATPVKNISRVTPAAAKKLERLGIFTARDFLFHFPFRYENYSQTVPASEIHAGQTATVAGTITGAKTVRAWKRKMHITEITVSDESGSVRAVWFNQPYLSEQLQIGKEIRLSGKARSSAGSSANGKNALFNNAGYNKRESATKAYFSNPAWEFSRRDPTHTGRLVPVYPETEGLSSRWIRWQIKFLFDALFKIKGYPASVRMPYVRTIIPDPLPENILAELNLPDLATALLYIHFPKNEIQPVIARKRFAFEEMLLVQIKTLQTKNQWEKEKSASIPFDQKLIKSFADKLPFKLTDAQRKAAFEILKDLEKEKPMNRLLNGDVGSGKTIVAAIAALQTAAAGYQTAIMAPTEVLARQHFLTFSDFLKNYGFSVALLTNSYREIKNFRFPISDLQKKSKLLPKKNKPVARDKLLSETRNGKINLLIGTHALIQEDIKFKNLALAIVDEQHRFGVVQRAHLQQEIEKINDGLPEKIPHFLTMTATPIPRTLSLAYFGNLDLSILDEMPKNRKKIITRAIDPVQKEKVYDFVKKQIRNGRQTFIILPFVEESKMLTEVKAAVAEHRRLSEEIFSGFKLGLLHGRLKSAEKEKVMREFKNKKTDILIATPVVEVGIDIPNATVMIIEDADRFGLSQLHQLRGRVGRGDSQSYCFLFAGQPTENGKKRLRTLVENQDGFKIAEKDLEIRGPGEFLGTRQSGLSDIAMENLTNAKLIRISKDYARKILASDPSLKKHLLIREALRKFEKKAHLE